jgi:hypothetical protein
MTTPTKQQQKQQQAESALVTPDDHKDRSQQGSGSLSSPENTRSALTAAAGRGHGTVAALLQQRLKLQEDP